MSPEYEPSLDAWGRYRRRYGEGHSGGEVVGSLLGQVAPRPDLRREDLPR